MIKPIAYFTSLMILAYSCVPRGETIILELVEEPDAIVEPFDSLGLDGGGDMSPFDVPGDLSEDYKDNFPEPELSGDSEDITDKLITDNEDGIDFVVETLKSWGFDAKIHNGPVQIKPYQEDTVELFPEIYFNPDKGNSAKDGYLDFVAQDETPTGFSQDKFPKYVEIHWGTESEIIAQLESLLGDQ